MPKWLVKVAPAIRHYHILIQAPHSKADEFGTLSGGHQLILQSIDSINEPIL